MGLIDARASRRSWSRMPRDVCLALAVVGILAVATACSSSSASDPLARLRWSDEDPAWSPDGRWIAFDSDRVSQGQTLKGIFVTGANGTDTRRLTPPGTDAEFPAWSPDGRQILYVSNLVSTGGSYSGDAAIALIRADGKRIKPLSSTGSCSDASWSPDGRWIAFDRGGCGSQQSAVSLDLIAADGKNARRIRFSGNSQTFGWSPDSRKLAFDCFDGDLCVLNVRDEVVRRLTHRASGDPFEGITSIAWSPDGRQIAYIHGTGGSYQPDYDSWVIDANGRKDHRLPRFGEGNASYLLWLPHHADTLLAAGDAGGPFYLVRSDGHGKHDLRAYSDGSWDSPDPSPDGRKFVFVRWDNSGKKSALFVANIHGLALQLTQATH
jgi:Tol biopolymer transport system component